QTIFSEGLIIGIDSLPSQHVLKKTDGRLFDEGVFGERIRHRYYERELTSISPLTNRGRSRSRVWRRFTFSALRISNCSNMGATKLSNLSKAVFAGTKNGNEYA